MAPTIVVAAGGSGGHILPAMAFADAVMRHRPDAKVIALGTPRGLDSTLIPARGYQLEMIPPVPMPRKVTPELLRLPFKVRNSVRQTREILERVQADVVVGFGGYVALPAYLAARGRIPVVVHEANRSPGLANKVGARFADKVAVAVAGTPLPKAEIVGIPLRHSISSLDRAALRAKARAHFGLDPDAPTLLVFGGSQGAQSLNNALSGAARDLTEAGIGVLHGFGPKNSLVLPEIAEKPPYVALPFIEQMDLAYAAADAVICRSGAITVAEVSAVGLPAVFVPLPHGNGEQNSNAQPAVDAGAALMILDDQLTSHTILEQVLPMVKDPNRLAIMSAAGVGLGHGNASDVLARMVLDVAGKAQS